MAGQSLNECTFEARNFKLITLFSSQRYETALTFITFSDLFKVSHNLILFGRIT